jgi:hypothetical protein
VRAVFSEQTSAEPSFFLPYQACGTFLTSRMSENFTPCQNLIGHGFNA